MALRKQNAHKQSEEKKNSDKTNSVDRIQFRFDSFEMEPIKCLILHGRGSNISLE